MRLEHLLDNSPQILGLYTDRDTAIGRFYMSLVLLQAKGCDSGVC
jgi:hypothetical protein